MSEEELKKEIIGKLSDYHLPSLLDNLRQLVGQTQNVPADLSSEFNMMALDSINAEDEFVPKFVVGYLGELAMIHANPYRGKVPTESELYDIINEIYDYYRYDPELSTNPQERDIELNEIILYQLRQSSIQFPFQSDDFANHSRALVLFSDDRLQKYNSFNFRSRFRNHFEVSLLEFASFGYIVWTLSRSSNKTLRMSDFKKARNQGLKLPNKNKVKKLLTYFAADPKQIEKTHEKFKSLASTSTRFDKYYLNPLVKYPLLHPKNMSEKTGFKRFFRLSTTLISQRLWDVYYYEFLDEHGKKFTDWFSDIHEDYCGEILQNSFKEDSIYKEDDIKDLISQSGQKIVDWLVKDGNTTVLFECKASRIKLDAKASNDEDLFIDQLEDYIKGINQLNDLANFISKGKLESLIGNTEKIYQILVTQEPVNNFFNSELTRQYLETLESVDPSEIKVQFRHLGDLEQLQPHFDAGYRLNKAMRLIDEHGFYQAGRLIADQTKKSYGDSFLHNFDKQIHKKIGIDRYLD